MPSPPIFDIALDEFYTDPYPSYARMRREAPICFVPQLGSVLLTRRDDIFVCEKNIEVFSSEQPQGLMNRLMGHNMMRKDGEAHLAERRMAFPALSPKTAVNHWRDLFAAHAEKLLADLVERGSADLHAAFALPYSAECLKSLTGLTNIRYQDMDAWSQAMIAGISNYHGDAAVEASCKAATRAIDAAIDDMLSVVKAHPDWSLLSVMHASGMPEASVRANVKLAISGGQNEPRHVILGCVWALLTHPRQRVLIERGELSFSQVFDEYVRWLSPIGMAPRRVAKAHVYRDCEFEQDNRVFLMFGAANRDEACFERAEEFDARRDNAKSVPFGAGPHFCAGAAAARTMIATVALPKLFAVLSGLSLDTAREVRISGWAFRGLQNLPVRWDA